MNRPQAAAAPHDNRWSLAAAALAAIASAFLVLGYDGRRIAQLLLLMLPLLAWMAWPVASPAARHARRAAVWLWVMLFAADGAVRAFLLDAYQAAPDGSLVLGAVANTNEREGGEYLLAHWRGVVMWAVVLAGAAFLAWRLAGMARRAPAPRMHNKYLVAALALVVLLGSVAYASKPWRRLHPLAFWTNWTQSLQALQAGMADQRLARDEALRRAAEAAPEFVGEGPSTVVLAITESVNRDNMSLYGYERDTTPRLLAQRRLAGDHMLVMRNAWSVDASTLPALRNMLSFGEPEAGRPQHLLALARAAGYKTWWLSNHDDIAIEQQHARLADVVSFANRTPGRSSASLDGELLDDLQRALEHPAPRKLIVVHMLGAHPHYSLRFPEGANPFDDAVDAVAVRMQTKGRAAWVREFRQDYDAALLYHDFVASETLRLTQASGDGTGHRAWMFVSDHGQEVGHVSDRVGHSPNTESGYRIPALVWRSQAHGPAAQAAAATQAFRADWAGWTVADLLQLRWSGQRPGRNLLAADYRWEPPALPFQVPSFVD